VELPDQRLESIDLAKRKPPEQIHQLLYSPLRVRHEWVTSFFNASPVGLLAWLLESNPHHPSFPTVQEVAPKI
jgi:hypothetical protein